MKKQWIWPLVLGMTLTAYTIYTLLDTFVITRVYTVVEQETAQSVDTSGGQDDEIASEDGSADASGADEEGNSLSEDGNETETGESKGHSRGSAGGHGPGKSGRGTSGSRSASDGDDDETDQADAGSSAAAASEEGQTIQIGTYSDDDILIVITSYRSNDTDIYVADIQLSSADYLKTAFARSAYGRNVTDKTSNIAEEVGAILAINGDYYGAQESGYVIRGGVLYRSEASSDADEQEDLVIWEDGSFSIITESEIEAQELVDNGAQEVLSFGPALVEDGTVCVTQSDEVDKAMTDNPRTAIGILDELHYVFVVSDGRTDESEGLTLYELAEFMESLGADCAYNLDGGGSSTMVFNGEVINNPTTNGSSIKERSVSDIVYIGY